MTYALCILEDFEVEVRENKSLCILSLGTHCQEHYTSTKAASFFGGINEQRQSFKGVSYQNTQHLRMKLPGIQSCSTLTRNSYHFCNNPNIWQDLR